jgi:hypothetical protein
VTYPVFSRFEVGGLAFYSRFSHSFPAAVAGAATRAVDQYFGARTAVIARF